MADKVILCKCPICDKDARTIDHLREAGSHTNRCDSNETFHCYRGVDNENLRFLLKKKRKHDIDWHEVERIEKGVVTATKNNK